MQSLQLYNVFTNSTFPSFPSFQDSLGPFPSLSYEDIIILMLFVAYYYSVYITFVLKKRIKKHDDTNCFFLGVMKKFAVLYRKNRKELKELEDDYMRLMELNEDVKQKNDELKDNYTECFNKNKRLVDKLNKLEEDYLSLTQDYEEAVKNNKNIKDNLFRSLTNLSAVKLREIIKKTIES